MYRIMIDPVGGGNNYGLEYQGRYEKDDTIKLANILCDKLEDKRQEMIGMTRYGDTDITVKERVAIVTFAKPDLLISIHRSTKNGLQYYTTPNSIASNIMQLLSLRVQDMYTSIESITYKSKILETESPVLTFFINNIYSGKENEFYDNTYKTFADQFTEVIDMIDHNSPETIKNIINGLKTHDTILSDTEGYFLVGPHPGYDEGVIWKGKSLNQAIRVCNEHINLHVFRSNDPNAESLHKSNMKRLSPASYINPLIKYQNTSITTKTGARSFEEKSFRSRCVTVYPYGKNIKIFATKSDMNWVYVIDSQNGNGYVPRKCVSI